MTATWPWWMTPLFSVSMWFLWEVSRQFRRARLHRPLIRAGLRAPLTKRAFYRTCYLQSDHWRQLRGEWWRKFPEACCVQCGKGHPLDLHHTTYARVGHELLSDLEPRCRTCHDYVHGFKQAPARRYAA